LSLKVKSTGLKTGHYKSGPPQKAGPARRLENGYRAGGAIGGKTIGEVNWKR